MALPGSTGQTEYGIGLAWSINTVDSLGNPVNPQTQVLFATNSTGPFLRLTTTPAGTTSYTHVLQNDGTRRYYRVRHILAGYESSTALGNVDAKPAIIYEN